MPSGSLKAYSPMRWSPLIRKALTSAAPSPIAPASASLMLPIIRQFHLRGLIRPDQDPLFADAMGRAARLRNSAIAEAALPGYESSVYAGLFAPIRTPAPVVQRLHREAVQYLNTPEANELFLRSGGADVVAASPQESRKIIQSELQRLGKVIREAHIQDK